MSINWRIRAKNKNFSIAIIPAILLLIQAIAQVFGFTIDFGKLGNNLLDVVNAAFVVLSLLGIVTDPTTQGVSDSTQALLYTEPKKKA